MKNNDKFLDHRKACSITKWFHHQFLILKKYGEKYGYNCLMPDSERNSPNY